MPLARLRTWVYRFSIFEPEFDDHQSGSRQKGTDILPPGRPFGPPHQVHPAAALQNRHFLGDSEIPRSSEPAIARGYTHGTVNSNLRCQLDFVVL